MRNGKSIRGAISYNETKVRAGKAELIMAGRFGCEVNKLSFSQKLKRFTLLVDKSTSSSFNTVHLSLNFSPEDQLDNEKLQQIARDYMQALGFEKQPYLVYRHDDTAHPHIHIVTTPIKPNGKTINLHNLVQRKSEPARKMIEEGYGLIKAEGRSVTEAIEKIDGRVQYGKQATKQAVAQIVRSVFDTYRFTSLAEYDLILRQFNITADAGNPGTRLQSHKGLQYFIINAKGGKAGVPIKASSIYTNPGIKNLEKRFERNRIKKEASRQFTGKAVQYALNRSTSKNELIRLLAEKKIAVVYDHDGLLHLIDHRNRTVSTSNELNLPSDVLEQLRTQQQVDPGFSLQLLENLFDNEYTNQQIDRRFYKKKKKRK